MDEYDRTVLLERVNREGATVGATIPETIELEEEEVPLRERVLELAGREAPTAAERERIATLKRGLRGRRKALVERLEGGECSRAEGEAIVGEITGIDRALNALEGVGEPDLEEQARQRERTDKQRWMSFLRQALGHEDSQQG